MPRIHLQFPKALTAGKEFGQYIFLGQQLKTSADAFCKSLPASFNKKTVLAVAQALDVGESRNLTELATAAEHDQPATLVNVALSRYSSESTRFNSPARGDLLTDAIKKALQESAKNALAIVSLSQADHLQAAASAIARAFPTYTRKTDAKQKETVELEVHFMVDGEPVKDFSDQEIERLTTAVRATAYIFDQPANEFTSDSFVELATEIADTLKCQKTIIRGKDLEAQGFGGIWGVGKAAVHSPALVVLSYTPEKKDLATKTVALVGKGIIFDTGGLSIKINKAMEGMKGDMGGAAALLYAFQLAVLQKSPHNLHVLLCIAENSVDMHSQRPDDIVTMYSTKTVEVNNTDAEGRLVLGDGVAYAYTHLQPNLILDMATLTGAQAYATGLKNALVMSNSKALADMACEAGTESGDLCAEGIYCPERLMPLFKSEVADMKNAISVADANSSCAGHFIEAHIVNRNEVLEGKKAAKYTCDWLHFDIAGPSSTSGRSNGFGVSLVYRFLQKYGAINKA